MHAMLCAEPRYAPSRISPTAALTNTHAPMQGLDYLLLDLPAGVKPPFNLRVTRKGFAAADFGPVTASGGSVCIRMRLFRKAGPKHSCAMPSRSDHLCTVLLQQAVQYDAYSSGMSCADEAASGSAGQAGVKLFRAVAAGLDIQETAITRATQDDTSQAGAAEHAAAPVGPPAAGGESSSPPALLATAIYARAAVFCVQASACCLSAHVVRHHAGCLTLLW